MGHSGQPLTPLEFVDLGIRLTEKHADELAIAHLIEKARAVVHSGLRSTEFALDQLGVDPSALQTAIVSQLRAEDDDWKRRKALRTAIFGESIGGGFPYASEAPKRMGGSPKGVSIPESLTVVTGTRKRYPTTKAVVLKDGWSGEILVLGDSNRSWVYGNWSRASEPILGYKDPSFWDLKKTARIDPEEALL